MKILSGETSREAAKRLSTINAFRQKLDHDFVNILNATDVSRLVQIVGLNSKYSLKFFTKFIDTNIMP